MPEAWQWWYVYGPFREGVNGLPHIGDVIKYYRNLRGYSIQQFAAAYNCTVNHAWQLEGSKNMSKPINPGKRQLLADILKVPPTLLGLSLIGSSTPPSIPKDTQDMLLEDMLELSWQAYYNGDFQQATRNIATWLYAIEHSVANARGTDKAHLQAIWVKFLNLSTASLRDRGATNDAIAEAHKALTLSRELGNVDLIVASLYQSFRCYDQAEDYKSSCADIEEALAIVKSGRISSVLVGTVRLSAGELWSELGRTDIGARRNALRHFDVAANIAREVGTNAEFPGIYVKLGLSRILLERSVSLANFGQTKGAVQDMSVALSTLPTGNVRWRKDALLSRARLSIEEGANTQAITFIRQAIQMHQEFNSKSDYFWARLLCRDILRREPTYVDAKQLLATL